MHRNKGEMMMKRLILALCCALLLCSCNTLSLNEHLEEANTLAQEFDGYAYYRGQLNGEEKDLYDLLYYHILQHDTTYQVSVPDEQSFLTVMDYVIKDHPELFWYDRSEISYTDYSKGNHSIYEINVKEKTDRAALDQLQKDIEEAAAPIIAQIKAQPTDFDKVKVAYDYIIDRTDYQEGSEDNQNIISVFINQASVCAGYAKSLQYLLNAAGVPCTYMTGDTLYSPDSHAWNMVRINNRYYYVDTTNGDYSKEDIDQRFRYAYFAMDTEQMLKLFKPDDPYELTNALEDNYFYKNGLYVTSADMTQIQKLIQQGVADQSHSLLFQCSTDQVCDTITQQLDRNDQFFYMVDQTGYRARELQTIEIPETNVWLYQFH